MRKLAWKVEPHKKGPAGSAHTRVAYQRAPFWLEWDQDVGHWKETQESNDFTHRYAQAFFTHSLTHSAGKTKTVSKAPMTLSVACSSGTSIREETPFETKMSLQWANSGCGSVWNTSVALLALLACLLALHWGPPVINAKLRNRKSVTGFFGSSHAPPPAFFTNTVPGSPHLFNLAETSSTASHSPNPGIIRPAATKCGSVYEQAVRYPRYLLSTHTQTRNPQPQHQPQHPHGSKSSVIRTSRQQQASIPPMSVPACSCSSLKMMTTRQPFTELIPHQSRETPYLRLQPNLLKSQMSRSKAGTQMKWLIAPQPSSLLGPSPPASTGVCKLLFRAAQIDTVPGSAITALDTKPPLEWSQKNDSASS